MSESGYEKWHPKAYLEQYYSTDVIAEDEQRIFEFVANFFKTEKDVPEMLDFGSGPTIHHILPFVSHVGEIYVADYLPANLHEVQKWLRAGDDAHDWRPYISASIKLEGKNPTAENTSVKIEEVRRKVTHLLHADIFKNYPLEISRTFPLVTSFYCAECATTSKVQWRKGIRNLSHTIAPGGWLIMSALRKATSYKAGEHHFPSANITESELFDALRETGFDKHSIVTEVHPIKQWAKEGFRGIILCKAKKLA